MGQNQAEMASARPIRRTTIQNGCIVTWSGDPWTSSPVCLDCNTLYTRATVNDAANDMPHKCPSCADKSRTIAKRDAKRAMQPAAAHA